MFNGEGIMTLKDKVVVAAISGDAYTADELIRCVRPVIFAELNDGQKHMFMRMSVSEQEIFIEELLKDIGIKIPAMRF